MKPRYTGGTVAPNPNRNRNRNRNLNRNSNINNSINKNRNRNNQNRNKKQFNKNKQQNAGPQYKGLFAPKELLEGPRLRKAVEQLVQFQTRPSIREANRGINELTKNRELDISREKNLGLQAGQNIAKYYNDLAASETQKLQGIKQANEEAKTGIAQSGREALAEIQLAGQKAGEGIGGYEGQSIASRDRLAEMIATQGATAANQNNALNAQAASGAESWAGLMSLNAQAGQQRGGEILGDTRRQVLGQIGNLKREYGQDISKLRNAKLELLLQRPELTMQALSNMRESERNFLLSKGALGLEKAKFKGEQEGTSGASNYAKESTKQYIKLAKVKAQLRMEYLEASGATNQQLAQEKSRLAKQYAKLTSELYGGKNGGSKAGGWIPYNKAFSIARGSGISRKDLVEGYGDRLPKQVRTGMYDMLRRNGVSDKVARKVIKKYMRQYKKNKVVDNFDIF